MMQGLMMRRAGWARRPAFAAATPRALVRLERPMSALTHQRASASFALQHLRHEHVLAQPAAAAAARMGAQCGGVVVAAACTWGAARALADQRMAACDSKFLHERSAHVVRRTSKPRIVINDDIPMLSRLTRMIRRVLSLMLLSLPLVFGVPLALTLGRLIPLIEELCWEYALRAVHRAGPTYIKLAQWASSRSDLFPEQFCRTFERLHDSVFPHPWRDTQRILARELGPGWESELRLRPEVIGSGCIAQVYKGTLTPKRPLAASGVLTGPMEVAVKVIHPGVEYMVAVDLDIMRSIARALALVPALRWLSLPDVVEDFALQMVWQLDLRQEAHNLQRLHANFSEDRGIHIPLPVMEHTSRDVLIETFEDGVPITQFIESEACCAESKKELSRLGMNSMAKMIFIDNFVHCDLHPGNILVSGTVGNLVMIYLDAGIVKELRPDTHKMMLSIMHAFLSWDGKEAGKLMVENASEQLCADVDGFCDGIQQIIDDSKTMPFFQNFAEYTARIFNLACTHKVKLEGNFITIALAMKVCEGLSIRLDPDIEMVKGCIPWLAKAQLHHGMNLSQAIFQTHGVTHALLSRLTV